MTLTVLSRTLVFRICIYYVYLMAFGYLYHNINKQVFENYYKCTPYAYSDSYRGIVCDDVAYTS
jgi:hypothetical protein